MPITISNYDSSFVTDVTQPGNHAGGGKPLVLVHGFSQTAEQFKFQIEGLADRYRVITLDLRGHGESEKPNFGLKMHRLAEDLREALIAAKANDVTLLGHSMGRSVICAY